MIYKIWESTKASLTRYSPNKIMIMRRAEHDVKAEIYCVVWVLHCTHSFQVFAIPSDLTRLCHLLPEFPHHCHPSTPGKHRSPLVWRGAPDKAAAPLLGPAPLTAVPSHPKGVINCVLTLNITSHWEVCFRVRIHLQSSHSPGKDGQTSCRQAWHLLQGQAEKSHGEFPSERKHFITTS